MIELAGTVVEETLAAAPVPIAVHAFEDRLPAYDGSGGRIGVVAPSLGLCRDLGSGAMDRWRATCERFGQEAVERSLNGGAPLGDYTLARASAVGMLSGSAAALCALQVVRDVFIPEGADSVELWAVKWGLEALVFRCAVTHEARTAVYALNVARDTTAAAEAVRAAAAALADDYARDPAHVVRPLGLCETQLGVGLRVPVAVTEWATGPDGADLDELHIDAAHAPQFRRWVGRDVVPLSDEASVHAWREAIANIARYSYQLPDGRWQLEQLGIGAGDLVGDGDRIVRKVWSRKQVSTCAWHPLAAALLAHATDGDRYVFLDDPALALDAFGVPGAAAAELAALVRAGGAAPVARVVLGAAPPAAIAALERAIGSLALGAVAA
jgi:hypothetical protein